MFEPAPTRRDPRLLVVVLGRVRPSFAALDAWELRALGTLPPDARARRLSLWRLLVRAKPSHLLVVGAKARAGDSLARMLRERALHHGLPISFCDAHDARALARQAPLADEVARSYPELRHLATVSRASALRTVRVALGALLTRSLPPRRYVPGLPARPARAVDAGRAPAPRAPSIPHRAPRRRPPRAA